MNSRVSIIVPVFNTSSYLERCLNSLVAQTMKEIEIICIDDSSTDDSDKILYRYSQKDSRIKIIKHEINLGLAAARNSGIALANSEYILCVDSDDSIHLDSVRRLWEASKQGFYDVVCFGYCRLTNQGVELSKKKFKSKSINQSRKINIFKMMNPSLCNKLWKRKVFLDNNIKHPEGLFFEDMAVTPLLLANSKKVRFIDECLYFYYSERCGSITSTFSAKHIIDYFKVYEFLFLELTKRNLIDCYYIDLIEYINKGLNFHAEQLMKSNLKNSERTQYLRFMLILKNSFFDNHKKLLSYNQQALVDLLAVPQSIIYVDSSIDRTGYVKRLSNHQLIGIRLYSNFFSFLITSNQKNKLKNNPELFFYDSSHAFTRFIGKVLRII